MNNFWTLYWASTIVVMVAMFGYLSYSSYMVQQCTIAYAGTDRSVDEIREICR